MIGYVKYFLNGGNNKSFIINDDDVLDKYNKNWNKIKEKFNIKFRTMLVFDEKYIKAKVKEFNSAIKTNFLGNKIPKGSMYWTSIACILIDSVMRMAKIIIHNFF